MSKTILTINDDIGDLLFRVLFSSIFIGLGVEHIFSDHLIQTLIPAWMPHKRLMSIFCGSWLLIWGCFIMVGWRIRYAAVALGFFLAIVTVVIHLPGILTTPEGIPPEYIGFWVILQRSNLAKNLCLLGVCFHLLNHSVGIYSLEIHLARKRGKGYPSPTIE